MYTHARFKRFRFIGQRARIIFVDGENRTKKEKRMKRKILLSVSVVLVILCVWGAVEWAQPTVAGKRVTVYRGDEINVSL